MQSRSFKTLFLAIAVASSSSASILNANAVLQREM